MHKLCLFVAIGLSVGCGAAPIVAPPPPTISPPSPVPPVTPAPDKVAAWGDSFTAGLFPDDLAALLDRPVFNGGVGGETSVQILARIMADTVHRKDAAVLWIGRNNFGDPERVKADIARAVASLENPDHHFVVLSIVNGDTPSEWLGGPDYATIAQLNADLAAAYPGRFLDVRSLLVSHYDPTSAQDVIDHQHDVPPASLRANTGSLEYDFLHPNPSGTELIATRVAEFFTANGW